MKPICYTISETDEFLVSHTGLALIGALVQHSDLLSRVDEMDVGHQRGPAVAHGDVVASMIGLMSVAKPDFGAIEEFRDNDFFAEALGLDTVPSEPTLRQRIDALAETGCGMTVIDEAVEMVARHAPDLKVLHERWIPMDVDVSPFDNSETKKEGVGRTYHKVDGYAPIFAYVGEEGYQVDCELRQGRQHSQKETPEFLRRAIPRGKKLLRDGQRLLVRMDSGFDDEKNLRALRLERVDWIIKRNLRQESHEEWLEIAYAHGEITSPRDGKERVVGHTFLQRDGRSQRVVYQVDVRSTDSNGQKLLIPDVEIATYWTSIKKLSAEEILALYRQHATSEQFHSEVKSDLDLERLPSGKFATNSLLLSIGLFAFNALRLCGQEALRQDRDLPPTRRMVIRRKGHRRRLRRVIQDLIYMASRVVRHARRAGLRLWVGNPWHSVWNAVYQSFAHI